MGTKSSICHFWWYLFLSLSWRCLWEQQQQQQQRSSSSETLLTHFGSCPEPMDFGIGVVSAFVVGGGGSNGGGRGGVDMNNNNNNIISRSRRKWETSCCTMTTLTWTRTTRCFFATTPTTTQEEDSEQQQQPPPQQQQDDGSTTKDSSSLSSSLLSSLSSSNTTTKTRITPPQYKKRSVVLHRAEKIGDGSSILLHIDRLDDDIEPFTYQPGHVLALEIPLSAAVLDNPSNNNKNDDNDDFLESMNAKTLADAHDNDGWMRGPYTVSSANTQTLTILIKVVGPKSQAFAQAQPGTLLRLGGKFHIPIVDGIQQVATGEVVVMETTTETTTSTTTEAKVDQDNVAVVHNKNNNHKTTNKYNRNPLRRVVLISTGVGIGPCVGAVEKLLFESNNKALSSSSSSSFMTLEQIDLYASFRYANQVLYQDYLDMWSLAYQDDPNATIQFCYIPIITSQMGRLSSTKKNLQQVISSSSRIQSPMSSECTTSNPSTTTTTTTTTPICTVSETHYHLIGNGQMVQEWKAGLIHAGVIPERITVESCFRPTTTTRRRCRHHEDKNNNKSQESLVMKEHDNDDDDDDDVIQRIAKVISQGAQFPSLSSSLSSSSLSSS